MKVAIMQPYFFPYLPYFQLISSVDLFVIYDDVNYIKQGWINRNTINLNGIKQKITLELKGASSFKKINEITIGNNRLKILKTIYHAYHKAPFFEEVYQLISRLIKNNETLLNKYLEYLILELLRYLNINTPVKLSSNIIKNESLSGQDKVIAICKYFGADTYVNSIGGMSLYNDQTFFANNIQLRFLEPDFNKVMNNIDFSNSIIHLMMNMGGEKIKKIMPQFKLI